MPAAAMLHVEDPRDALLKKIGDISDIELCHNQVLVAVYMAPEKTSGGIVVPISVRDEDRHQGKVGLILKVGPLAFKDDTGKWVWPDGIGVGDWVYFRTSDGWQTTVNSHRDNLCRHLSDADIKGRIQHPDKVW